jgi:hypothetical protein
MHLIKYIQKDKTPTCFETGVPSSGSRSEPEAIYNMFDFKDHAIKIM